MIISAFVVSLIALIMLFDFSKRDFKESKVSNHALMPFLIIGVVICLLNGNLIPAAISGLLMGIVGYTLWNKEAIGAADVKILAILPLYFGLEGFPQFVVGIFFFLCIFLVVGIFYSFGFKLLTKSQDKIPFVPAIAITYLIFCLLRYLWIG